MGGSRTSPFRKQHDGILEIITGILNNLDENSIKENSHNVRKLIAKLAGIVKVHLVLEDNSLYPLLANNDNTELREISAQFMDEMGDISKSFTDYLKQWSTASSIKSETSVFIKETKTVLNALKQRIDRENEKFYKLIDEIL